MAQKNPNVLTVEQAGFDALIRSTEPVLVDFWAEWCGPCRTLGPVIDDIATEFAGRAKVGKLNVDDNPQVAARYGVRSIPSVMLFQNGKLVQTLVGVHPKNDYAAALNGALAGTQTHSQHA